LVKAIAHHQTVAVLVALISELATYAATSACNAAARI
jgi:hypothetical protein